MQKAYPTLADLEKVHQNFEARYKALLLEYPASLKSSLDVLLRYPMTLSLLTANMKTTVAIGDLYRRNPALTKRLTDSLHQELVKRDGAELEDWKEGIKKDTSVQKELKHIANKYASEDDSDDVYASSSSSSYDPAVINDIAPYPYWAGYPYWLGENYWYPYPWWIQMGLYWPEAGPYVIFGLPRYHFGWWYYNHPFYYGLHPHTSTYFNNHYYGHRGTSSGFNRSIQQFGGHGGAGGGRRR